MDIYTILSSKPHNPHYLNRYIIFIKHCQLKNVDYEGYTEKHHICPKAKDMFPEYSSFSNYPWNCAVLTARQHFIAHMMLWKVYQNESMIRAFGIMSNYNEIKSSKIYESIKVAYSVIVSEQMSGTVSVKHDNKVFRVSKKEFDENKELSGHTKGKTFALDRSGNGHYVSSDDVRFKTGELRGNNAGTITITNGKTNKRIKPEETIPEGWYRGMTKNSPKKSVWINDGKTSKMFKGEHIPEGWTRGRVYSKKPKHVGTTGKICINNGKVNKMIEKYQSIQEGWVRGRLHIN